jgi:xylan 1,4-beta-xylosidase
VDFAVVAMQRGMTASLLMVTAALACLVNAAGAAIASVGFTAALDAPSSPLSRAMVESFGSSHGATTLRERWRSHFRDTLADIPFRRVRFHGILDDDMSTLLDGRANGALVFDTLDFLTALGIAPTIELSFMPQALASNASQTTFHYKGGISMYKDRGAYMAFITEFTALLVERYGLPAVESWRFEVNG